MEVRPRPTTHSVVVLVSGARPDRGPPASRPGGSGQEHQGVVHQGAQDQSHLPHAEHVQPGRHAEVSDRRVLVSGGRPRQNPAGATQRNGQSLRGGWGWGGWVGWW